MFFVRKENIATTTGTQKEFAAAQRRGIGFFAQPTDVPNQFVWNYLFPANQMEPSLRAASPTATHFIWQQQVAPATLVGEPLITPFRQSPPTDEDSMDDPTHDWEAVAKAAWVAQQPADAQPRQFDPTEQSPF